MLFRSKGTACRITRINAAGSTPVGTTVGLEGKYKVTDAWALVEAAVPVNTDLRTSTHAGASTLKHRYLPYWRVKDATMTVDALVTKAPFMGVIHNIDLEVTYTKTVGTTTCYAYHAVNSRRNLRKGDDFTIEDKNTAQNNTWDAANYFVLWGQSRDPPCPAYKWRDDNAAYSIDTSVNAITGKIGRAHV